MASFSNLIKDTTNTPPTGVESVRQKLASKNQFMAAQDVQRVQSRYEKDIKEGVAIQSAEVARVVKGESNFDGLLKRFESASGLSRKEIKSIGSNYTSGYNGLGNSPIANAGDAAKCPDLVLGVNLYDNRGATPPANEKRVGYNIVDLLDNVYTQLKKKHRIPALPGDAALTDDKDEYLLKDSVDPTGGVAAYDHHKSKLLTSSNVKDIRDFAKKALLPYVTAFFRAFELSDEMIHAAIEAKTDTNVKPGQGLTAPVLPVDTRGRMMYALTTEGLGEALALASMGSDPLKRMMPMIDFAFATSRFGGAADQEGGKKKRSSKKRASGRKMRGGENDQEGQQMEGGKKKRSSKKRASGRKMRGGENDQDGGKKKRSSKKRASGRKMRGGDYEQEGQQMDGGKKKRSSKKRASGRKMRGGEDQDGGKKKRSSKKRASGRKMRGGEQEGGKKKKSSSKKRSSGKRHGGAKKRSSKKRSSSRKH
jgi:hypothetical protein